MCDKCNDIHTAQKEGKQDKPCSCVCHPVTNIPAPSWEPYPSITFCTCGQNNITQCPIHNYGGTVTFTNSGSAITWV